MAQYNSRGWHFQSIRHSNARKYGKAGGLYKTRRMGYIVSSSKIPQGKFCYTISDAQKEMEKQMKSGASQSGISEVSEQYIIKGKPLKMIIQKLPDADKDGVPDKMDCEPKNPHKQHKFTRVISPIPIDELAKELTIDLSRLGYEVNFTADGKKLLMSNVRLGDKKIEMEGYNISPYTGRRGRILSWDNWVEVNNRINDVLDRHNVSANVNSLAGKFKIREGTKRFGEADWNEEGYSNVGSVMSPVSRRDAWTSTGKPTKIKHYGKSGNKTTEFEDFNYEANNIGTFEDRMDFWADHYQNLSSLKTNIKKYRRWLKN